MYICGEDPCLLPIIHGFVFRHLQHPDSTRRSFGEGDIISLDGVADPVFLLDHGQLGIIRRLLGIIKINGHNLVHGGDEIHVHTLTFRILIEEIDIIFQVGVIYDPDGRK